MPECQGCGRFVTDRFARVFGDNQDRVDGCQECMSLRELQEGAAAGKPTEYAYEHREQSRAGRDARADGGRQEGDE